MIHLKARLIVLSFVAQMATASMVAPELTSPQSITWFYSNSLSQGSKFLSLVGLREVPGLIQSKKCRIFHTTNSNSAFLGVCNTRTAPTCDMASSGNSEAVTFTIVVNNRTVVDDMHKSMLPLNSTQLLLSEASGSASFGAYGFTFFDLNTTHGLGCYRMEVQSFDDKMWPNPDSFLERELQNQLRQAGSELVEAESSSIVSCPCSDFCSGRCFAPACSPCPPSVWDGDETSCLNAGPLGHGLLCAPEDNTQPCCSPNGTACQLVGQKWCDCSKFKPQPALFPNLSNRIWSKTEGCIAT